MKPILRKILPPAAMLAVAALLFGAALLRNRQPQEPVSRTELSLNTVVTVTLYDGQDESLLDRCMDLCGAYEQMFSRTLEGSEISRLNRGETDILSPDAQVLLSEGLRYSALSDGAFDLTVGAVSSLWDFSSGEGEVPAPADIAAALPTVGWEKVELNGDRISLPAGTQIDPGAIAKGYIADRLKEFLQENGVESAIIDLGGNVLCIGGRPDGTPFRIGVRRPFSDASDSMVILEVDDRSVVTSGVYERYFEEDGVLYHHLLDPETGYPCDSGLLSVTILSDSSAQGDALSTACFVLGLEKGMELAVSAGVEAIFIDENYELHFTPGFSTPYTLPE